MKRILVIRGGAIGDFILTLPAIRLVREKYPQAHIEILGYKHIAAVAENRFYAQAVRSIEYGPLARFFARDAELPAELCEYFQSFGLAISYLFDPDQIFERNVQRAGLRNFVSCSPKIEAHGHAARQLARPLGQLGLVWTGTATRLFPSPDDRQIAQTLLEAAPGRVIALHPGSGSEKKNWPLDQWLLLAKRFDRCNTASLLIVGGEADEEQVRAFRSAFVGRGIQFAENLPLPTLAAVLEKCALFVGHDSGISHLAAAVATKCVLLFGPTDPAVWAPLGENVRVVQAAPCESMSNLSTEEVERACARFLRN